MRTEKSKAPKFSIITPTHNPAYLHDLYASVLSNGPEDWEWVIVPSRGAKVPGFADPRVRVIDSPFQRTDCIGLLKGFACWNARGEILVEVDHDDMLMPDCLRELRQVFDAEPETGFVYSNDAKLTEPPHQRDFDSAYGWTFDQVEFRGRQLTVAHSFEPMPSSVGFVWFCPNHVRAWRASVYRQIGGHDERMPVLDDHELIIRTYLATRMRHIPKPLYVYRIHPSNTFLGCRNAEIQTETVRLWNDNAERLVSRWADLNGLAKIDLGGAFACPPGYTSVDLVGGAVTADLSNGLPFADNSVGVVRAYDFLEHVADKQRIMSEIHRVLVDGGWLLSNTPSADGRGAFQDPTHVSYWNENSFWYWTRRQQAQFIRNTTVRFQEYTLDTWFPSEFQRLHNIPYVRAYLSAIKGGPRGSFRRPGLVLI
jgi:O-antigen biosynthesis protein